MPKTYGVLLIHEVGDIWPNILLAHIHSLGVKAVVAVQNLLTINRIQTHKYIDVNTHTLIPHTVSRLVILWVQKDTCSYFIQYI